MCNKASSGDTNHVKFHLHLPWIQLSLSHHEKGQRDRFPQAGNPRAAMSLLWNISAQPSEGALRRGGSQIVLVGLVQFTQLHSFSARPLCSTPGLPNRVLPDPAGNSAPSVAAFGSIDPFLQQMRPQGEVNPSRNVKRQVWASVNSLSLAKPLSPSLTFLPFILKYSD